MGCEIRRGIAHGGLDHAREVLDRIHAELPRGDRIHPAKVCRDGDIARPRLSHHGFHQFARGVRVELDLGHASRGQARDGGTGVSGGLQLRLAGPHGRRTGERIAGDVEARSRHTVHGNPRPQCRQAFEIASDVPDARYAV